MNKNIKISVIIPVYNVQRYLRQCLDSVVNQTFQDIEIILVNDGSTDQSLEICQEYKQMDQRIILLTQKNFGFSGCKTKGFGLCIWRIYNFCRF